MEIKKCNTRQSRVAEAIKRVLSEFLLHGSFYDKVNPSMISITDVTVDRCLQHAKIYFVPLVEYVSDEDCLIFLKKYTPKLRSHLGRKVHLRFVPEFSFIKDIYGIGMIQI